MKPEYLTLVPKPPPAARDPVAEALREAQSIRAGNLDLDTAQKLDRAIRHLVTATRKGPKCA